MRLVEKSEPARFHQDALTSFYAIDPHDAHGAEKAAASLQKKEYPRKGLADVLEEYNAHIGNDADLSFFRESTAPCVFSGQQLGLFGGPAYTVLKALSCLILSRQQGAVPMFWLATEDHDIAEIDHTFLVDNLGNLNKFHLAFPQEGNFVEDLTLTERHQSELERFCRAIGRKDLYSLIAKESSYARAMAKVMAALFKGTGLIFLEPRLLRPYAKAFFRKEITHCDEIADLLTAATRKLIQAGGQPVLDVGQATNLFLKTGSGMRLKVQRAGEGFKVGGTAYSEQRLLQLVDEEPERFSTNAAARCVLQSLLFPVASYAAGPGELAYYRQLKDYHLYHGISMPWIVPRLSMTVVTPLAGEMLEKIGAEPWSELPQHWEQVFPGIETGGDELIAEWTASAAKHFGGDLALEPMQKFIAFQSGKLQHKAVLSRLRKKGIAPHSLHYLANLFHPQEKRQERVINWGEFQSHAEYSMIKELLKRLNTIPRGHLYCLL